MTRKVRSKTASLKSRRTVFIVTACLVLIVLAYAFTGSSSHAMTLNRWKELTVHDAWGESEWEQYYYQINANLVAKYAPGTLATRGGAWLTSLSAHLQKTLPAEERTRLNEIEAKYREDGAKYAQEYYSLLANLAAQYAPERIPLSPMMLQSGYRYSMTEEEQMMLHDIEYRNPNDPSWTEEEDYWTLVDDSVKPESNNEKTNLEHYFEVQVEELTQCLHMWGSSKVVLKDLRERDKAEIEINGKATYADRIKKIELYGTPADYLLYGRESADTYIDPNTGKKISARPGEGLSSIVTAVYKVMKTLGILLVLVYATVHLFTLVAKENGTIESWIRLFIFTAIGVVLVANIDSVFRFIEEAGMSIYLRIEKTMRLFKFAEVKNITKDYTGAFKTSWGWQVFIWIIMITTHISIVAGAISYLFELVIRRIFAPIAMAGIAADGMNGARSGAIRYMFGYFGMYLRMAAFAGVIIIYEIAFKFIQYNLMSTSYTDTFGTIIMLVSVRVAAQTAISGISHVVKEVFQ